MTVGASARAGVGRGAGTHTYHFPPLCALTNSPTSVKPVLQPVGLQINGLAASHVPLRQGKRGGDGA